MAASSPSPAGATPTLLGFVLLWLVLDRTANALGSVRGEAGFIVCLAVIAAAAAIEMALSRRAPLQVLATLGLRAPSLSALGWSIALVAALLCFYPVYAFAAGARITIRADAAALILGVLAQGGVAEEVVFRGFLFRRLRVGRSFWTAAALAAPPFIAVHALLFFSLEFFVALASLLLAISLSFPLAWLFERSGGSIWPPAIVHAVIQGSIKLVEAGDAFQAMAIAWIAVSGIAPWAFFLMRAREPPRTDPARQ